MCDVLGGVPGCVTKCDKGEGWSKLAKNSVTYFMDAPCHRSPCFASTVSALIDEMWKEMGSEHNTLLIFKLRWLSKSKVLSWVFELSDQFRWFFLNQHAHSNFWHVLMIRLDAVNLHATLTFLNRWLYWIRVAYAQGNDWHGRPIHFKILKFTFSNVLGLSLT